MINAELGWKKDHKSIIVALLKLLQHFCRRKYRNFFFKAPFL